MPRSILLIATLCVGACATTPPRHDHPPSEDASRRADDTHPIPPAPVHAQLDRFKSLTGRWTDTDASGQPTGKTAHYRVTANGGAVVETLFPGSPHEMLTVYHLDGDTLMLTHYCVLQNQPRMRAAGPTEDNRVIRFDFADATGLSGAGDSHMHAVTFTFIDDDHFQATWVNVADGQAVHEVTLNMVRDGS